MTVPGWWVYLLHCADDTFYVGVARNLAQRLREHNGELRGGARYTQGRRPVTIYAAHACADRRAATQLEWRTKKLPRMRKAALPLSDGWLEGGAALLLAATDQQEQSKIDVADQPPALSES
jgi:putative endonuclease